MTLPQRLTDRKREAIVQAAIAEFRASGFDATSMDKIAARADVSKRTVYNHFPSKDDLFAEILIKLWESSQPQGELAYSSDQPLREQLLELLRLKMGMLSDKNFLDLARVAIAETIHSPERAQAMVARIEQREELLISWVRAAQSDGKLQLGDPQFLGYQLMGLLKSFAFWPQITMGKPILTAEEQKHIVESTAAIFLRFYQTPSSKAS